MKVFLLILTLAVSLQAAVISYNFEEQPLIVSTVSVTSTQGGVTLTVTRQNNSLFAVSDINGSLGPSKNSWAHRTLDPFQADNTNAWIFSLSAAVNLFSIELGDFAGDSDTWTLTAFDGETATGTNLGSVNGTWGTADLAVTLAQLASISASGIRSVVAIGGSQSFPMSFYWDNVTVNTGAAGVPEPGTMALLGAGLALCVLGLKRRRT